jgi:LysM repeat protein
MAGIVSNFSKFYHVKSGDSCTSIDTAAGITLAQFREWNTLIDATCSNFWVDYYVCIGV